jgi:hypothetical protein
MRNHLVTGPGISPHLAHLSGGWSVTAVRDPGGMVCSGFSGRVHNQSVWGNLMGNVGGMRASARRSAKEFPTLDFRGT